MYKSDPFCIASWGKQSYRTSTKLKTLNPKWNEFCVFLVNLDKQKDSLLKILVLDYDSFSRNDKLGVAYLRAATFFREAQNKPVSLNVPLHIYFSDLDIHVSNIMNGDVDKSANKGTLSIEIEITSRKNLEENILNNIFKKIDINKNGILETREILNYLKSRIKITKQEEDSLERVIRTKRILNPLDVIYVLTSNKIGNGKLLKKVTEQFLTEWDNLAKKPMLYIPADIKRNHFVQDRKTGLVTKEYIPKYIRKAMKLMYTKNCLPGFIKKKLVKLSLSYGEKYENKRNTAKQIRNFIKKYNVNVDEIEGTIDSFATFNDFFARSLKKGVRPLSEPLNDAVVTSPADCRMMSFRSFYDSTRFWVKDSHFTIARLLGPKLSYLSTTFKECTLVIARLAPQDYHRWHSPITGTMRSVTPISGWLLTVNPIAVNRKIDVFTANKRVICEFDTKLMGKVLVIAVGATCVGCIRLFLF
ncbi:phosphatidylserine decarboxylase, partial [Bonamia ostreae]